MSVRIVIDSASDITKQRADELHLDFMPLKTIFGEEEYLDGITLEQLMQQSEPGNDYVI